jgi:CheY-like chemotaxis protein
MVKEIDMICLAPPILIIEDNPVDLDLTLRAFTKCGLSNPIEVARDGEEALNYILEWADGRPTPVVILLDLKLPKMSGLEVLNRIKTNDKFAKVPVIMFSTSSEDIDIQEAYRSGVSSYIIKPVNFEKFLEIIAQVEVYGCELNKPPRGSR